MKPGEPHCVIHSNKCTLFIVNAQANKRHNCKQQQLLD